jgi:hypothetical protein
MQHGHGHSAWACTCIIDMNMHHGREHAAQTWTCCTERDIQHEHGNVTLKCTRSIDVNMQHGHGDTGGLWTLILTITWTWTWILTLTWTWTWTWTWILSNVYIKATFFVVAIAKFSKQKLATQSEPQFRSKYSCETCEKARFTTIFFFLRLAKAEFFSWVLRKSCKNFLSRFLHLGKKGPSCQTYLWATDVTLSYRHRSLNSRRHILSYRCSVCIAGHR